MQLYNSKVPRKGKGKGINEIQSFGVPVVNKETGLAEDFSYNWLEGKPLMQFLQEFVDFIEQHKVLTNQRAILESFVRGVDDTLSSVTRRAEIAKSEMIAWLLSEDLAEDEKKASDLASTWAQLQEFQAKCNQPVSSKESLAVERRKYVQSQKDAGIWKATLIAQKELENKTIADVMESAGVVAPVPPVTQ